MRFKLPAIAITIATFLQIAQAQNLENYHAILPEGKVEFGLNTTQVFIVFEPGKKKDDCAAAISRNKSLVKYGISKNEPVKGHTNSYQTVLKSALSESDYIALIKTLRTDTTIKTVAPFLTYKDGTLQTYTNRIIVKLKPGISYKTLEGYCNENKLTIIDKNQFSEGVYIIGVTKNTGKDALEKSQDLSKEKVFFEYAEVDFVKFMKKFSNDPFYAYQWPHQNTGSSIQYNGIPGADLSIKNAWQITMGDPSIKVAIIDEGVDLNHPDLIGNLLPGFDATGQGSNGGPSGDDAHGTNCAGIVAAVADNGIGVAGVAPNCKVIPVRIAYGNGVGWQTSDSWIANGLNWAWQTGNADIMSNSWGGGSTSSLINSAIDGAVQNGRAGLGTPVLFAAGNDNGSVSYPGNYNKVISVGASSMCDQRKSPTSCDNETFWGSNYGTNVDVFAPGVKIYSTDISGSNGYDSGDYFATFNGTSSATPNTAGVMALLLSANPTLTEQQARIALETNCDKVGGYNYTTNSQQPNGTWSNDMGYGRVNAYKSILQIAVSPCNGFSLLKRPLGLLSDGSGKNDYDNNVACEWLIAPDSTNATISLEFSAFDTELNNDIVKVYDGSSTTGILLGTFSGNSIPPSLLAFSGTMFVQFITNGTVTNPGWMAQYKTCKTVLTPFSINASGPTTFCGGTDLFLTAPGGFISYTWKKNGTAIKGLTSSIINASENGQYSVAVKTLQGCEYASANSIPLTVISSPGIVISTPGSSLTLCNSNNITLNAVSSAPNITAYQWFRNDTLLTGLTNSSIQATVSGIYTVSVTDATNCSNTSPQFYVSPTSLIISAIKTTVCVGDSVQLKVSLVGDNSTSISGYNYSWAPASRLSNPAISNPYAKPLSGTIYNVTVTEVLTGCKKATSINIGTLPSPSATIFPSGSTTFCDGQSLFLSAIGSSNNTYQWYKDGVAISGASSSSYIANTSGAYVVRVTSNINNCTGSTQPAVNIRARKPLAAIKTSAPNGTLCNTVNILLNAYEDSVSSYKWYKDGATISGASLSTYTAAASGNYTVKVTDYLGCSNTSFPYKAANVTVTAVALKPVICQSDSTKLSISWNGSANSGAVNENFDPINNSNWAQNTGTVNNYCGAVSGNALYFNDATTRILETYPLNFTNGGSVKFSLVIGTGSTSYCEQADFGEDIELQYSLNNGLTWNPYKKYLTGYDYTTFTQVIEVISGALLAPSVKFRWIQPSFSGSGFDNWALDDIQITPLNSNSGYTYSWSPTTNIIKSNTDSPIVFPQTTTTYTISIIETVSGCNQSASATVNVSAAPISNITVLGLATICGGDFTTLGTTYNSQLAYQWYRNNSSITGATNYTLNTSLSGDYILKAKNSNNCSSVSNTLNITSATLPGITITSTGLSNTICSTVSFNLVCTSAPGLTYKWYRNGILISGATSNVISLSMAGVYSVSTTGANGCTAAAYYAKNLIGVSVYSNKTSICGNDSTSLSTQFTGGGPSGTFNDNFDPINTAQWTLTNSYSTGSCRNSNVLYFDGDGTRTAVTKSLNTSGGGTISFMLMIANSGSPCGETADGGEDVSVEYSTDNGINWYNISTLYTGTNYLNFTQVTLNIPFGAYSSNTRFRWSQPYNSGYGYDNWALDDISITTSGSSSAYTYQWSPTTGLKSPNAISTIAKPLTNTNYGVLVTEVATGCSQSGSIAISVTTSTSTIVSASGPLTFCGGGSVTLSVPYNSNSYYQWYKDGNYISTGYYNTYVVSASGTYYVNVTNYSTPACNGSYSQNSANLIVSVLSTPSAIVQGIGSNTLCNTINSTLTCTTLGGASYKWLLNGSVVAGAVNPKLTTTNAGQYVVSITGANGCSNASSPYLITTTSISIYSNKTSICGSDSTSLSVQFTGGGSSGTFADNFDPINNAQWTLTNSFISSSCRNSNVLYFDGNGTRTAETSPINTNSGGTISFMLMIANSGSTCGETADSGEDVLLEYSTNNGLTWTTISTLYTGTNYINFTQVTANIPLGAYSSNTKFRWSQPYNSGSGFDNWALDDISISTTGSSSVYTYQWSPTTGLKIPTAISTIAKPLNSTTYSVLVTETATGCSKSASLPITVTPVTLTPVSTSGPLTFCGGGTVMLSVPYNSNSYYQWYVDGIPTSGYDYYYYTSTSGKYYVAITNYSSIGCNGSYIQNSAQVNVLQSSAITINVSKSNSNTSLCNGVLTTLTATNFTGAYYQWYKDGSGIQNATSNQLITSTIGNYVCNVTVGGCTGSSSTQYVSGNPIKMIAVGNKNSVCIGDRINLATSFTGGNISLISGLTYNWSCPTSSMSVKTTTTTYSIISKTSIFTLVVSDGYGCSLTDTVLVKIKNDGYTILTANKSPTLCANDSVILSAYSSGNLLYSWYKDDYLIIGEAFQALKVKQPGLYYGILSDKRTGYCAYTTTDKILVNKINQLDVQLTLNNKRDSLKVSGPLATRYNWYLNDQLLVQNSNNFILNPKNGRYYAKIEVSSCTFITNTVSVGTSGIDSNIDNYKIILYPNPNNDGLIKIDAPNVFNSINISVVNSVGVTVGEHKGLYSPSEINISYLPAGMYIFKISIGDYAYQQKVIVE